MKLTLCLPRPFAFATTWRLPVTLLAWLTALCLAPVALAQGQAGTQAVGVQEGSSGVSSGPVRLRQPAQTDSTADPAARGQADGYAAPPPTQPLSDFELHVRAQPGAGNVRALGVTLLDGLQRADDRQEPNPLVPPDYLLGAGDVLVVTIWGSVDADLRLQVDRSGRISIPRVGPIMVSGVRYGDLPEVISRRVGQVFRNYQISVSLAQLRGLRVYVTGFASRPGPVNVSSLSTLAQALSRAGGPAAAGSYRNIQLRRGTTVVSQFDYYDLLLKGDRRGDVLLQPEDVIHVAPVGPQVALIGSVNRPAIYELRQNETVADLLAMAGGFSAVADDQRLVLERIGGADASRKQQLVINTNRGATLTSGDVLRALNAAELRGPIGVQSKRVRIEGEVTKPGEYVLRPDSTLADALREAGGLTADAYLYAAVFTRESVRVSQQVNYDRALRDFETQIASAAATRRADSPEQVNALQAASTANSRLLEQLRGLRPSGRIVLQLATTADSLPELVLEDGDRLVIPARPTTVGVFGSVFSTGSYLYSANRTIGEYLRLAGGPTRGADEGSVFVIRANGAVSSSLQESGIFTRGNQLSNLRADPGDTIFVPEELNKTTWVQSAKDWTQILYQLGIGLAGMKSAVQ